MLSSSSTGEKTKWVRTGYAKLGSVESYFNPRLILEEWREKGFSSKLQRKKPDPPQALTSLGKKRLLLWIAKKKPDPPRTPPSVGKRWQYLWRVDFLQFSGGSIFCILQIYQFLETELPILEAPFRFSPNLCALSGFWSPLVMHFIDALSWVSSMITLFKGCALS